MEVGAAKPTELREGIAPTIASARLRKSGRRPGCRVLPGLSMLYDKLGITRKAGSPVPPVRTSESRPSRSRLADCDANVCGRGTHCFIS